MRDVSVIRPMSLTLRICPLTIFVILMMSDTSIRKQSMPKLIRKNTDWEAFVEKVEKNIDPNIRLKTKGGPGVSGRLL